MSQHSLSEVEIIRLSIAICVLSTIVVDLRLLTKWKSNVSFACDDWCLVDSLLLFYNMIACSTLCKHRRFNIEKHFILICCVMITRKELNQSIVTLENEIISTFFKIFYSMFMCVFRIKNDESDSHDYHDDLFSHDHKRQNFAFDVLSSNFRNAWLSHDFLNCWCDLFLMMFHDRYRRRISMLFYVVRVRIFVDDFQSMHQRSKLLLKYYRSKSCFECHFSVNVFVHDIRIAFFEKTENLFEKCIFVWRFVRLIILENFFSIKLWNKVCIADIMRIVSIDVLDDEDITRKCQNLIHVRVIIIARKDHEFEICVKSSEVCNCNFMCFHNHLSIVVRQR